MCAVIAPAFVQSPLLRRHGEVAQRGGPQNRYSPVRLRLAPPIFSWVSSSTVERAAFNGLVQSSSLWGPTTASFSLGCVKVNGDPLALNQPYAGSIPVALTTGPWSNCDRMTVL